MKFNREAEELYKALIALGLNQWQAEFMLSLYYKKELSPAFAGTSEQYLKAMNLISDEVKKLHLKENEDNE